MRHIWIIAAIMLCGLAVRFKDLPQWYKNYNLTFSDNKPILTCMDGYYYLRFARELSEGGYKEQDELRPGYNRPTYPPLMSSVSGFISRVSGASVEWIAFILAPIFGVLIFIPVYLLASSMYGRQGALFAGWIVLLAPIYAVRSGMGWFDTDVMNVTFPLMSAFCCMRFCRDPRIKGILFLGATVIITALYMIWWDSVPLIALLISSTPLLIGLIIDSLPDSRTKYDYRLFVLAFIIAVALINRTTLYTAVHDRLLHFTSVYGQASEQDAPNNLIMLVSGNPFIFAASVIGLIFLLVKRCRTMAYILPVLAVGLLGIKAERYLIFLAPCMALGLGFACSRLTHKPTIICIVTAIIALYTQFYATHTVSIPKLTTAQVDVMREIEHTTPTNAVIWAWWDYGYAVQYYSQRTALFDGTRHDTNVSGFPFATPDMSTAFAFIINTVDCTSSTHGRPIYIYHDVYMQRTAHWWLYHGLNKQPTQEDFVQSTWHQLFENGGLETSVWRVRE
jgi:asparagine N-glycosylation enzyme membrane subunit Stt3